MLSIVIPTHNEEASILALHHRLTAVLALIGQSYEIIFVDDASTDSSLELLAALVDSDPRLKVIQLRRNFGQTAALAAGFHHAAGDVIISMDGDLQHDPEDIPALLAKIEDGFDIASGWRKDRVDPLKRKLPSRIANWMMSRASGIKLHDFGTTFKAYRADILKQVDLYGELHRFIPALAGLHGAHVAEVPIRSVPRAAGRSHYGLGRTLNVLLDVLTIRFLTRYLTCPMHFFGRLGLFTSSTGALMLAWLAASAFGVPGVVQRHGLAMIAGILLVLAGAMLFSTGLISEILIRTYFESQQRPIYAVRKILAGPTREHGSGYGAFANFRKRIPSVAIEREVA